MCLIKRKQNVNNLFHVRMGRSESIRDFMKRATILQLEVISRDIVLQVVKQVICPNTQFFDSLSLHPPTTIHELFQRGNQYAMVEDDTVPATKRTVVATSEARHYDGNRGKRGSNSQDRKGKHEHKDSV